jgi:hypothetical protein
MRSLSPRRVDFEKNERKGILKIEKNTLLELDFERCLGKTGQ